jgi:hypothetical protein
VNPPPRFRRLALRPRLGPTRRNHFGSPNQKVEMLVNSVHQLSGFMQMTAADDDRTRSICVAIVEATQFINA